MRSVTFTTRLSQGDVFRVWTLRLLLHPLGVMALAAGPVFLAVGVASSSPLVTRTGFDLLPVTGAVIGFSLLLGTYAAYRPGAAELYEPVEWIFTPEGIEIVQPDRRAWAEWDELKTWRQAAGCYLLGIGGARFLIVPQHDVPDDDRDAFEQLLSARLGRRRR